MGFQKDLKSRLQQKEKALYVKLPHTIRGKDDVARLFTGDFKVQLPRQSSRHCYVVFSDFEEKMKNLKAAKDKLVNGKPVMVAPAHTTVKDKTKNKISRKKIVIPKMKEDQRITKELYVSNIKCETKAAEIKGALPGCVSVKLLQPYTKISRAAIVKMENLQIAAEYLTKVREWPTVRERKLRLNPDNRKRRRRKSKQLKIYNGDSENQSSASDAEVKDEDSDS